MNGEDAELITELKQLKNFIELESPFFGRHEMQNEDKLDTPNFKLHQ
jgi:hypothetical protein